MYRYIYIYISVSLCLIYTYTYNYNYIYICVCGCDTICANVIHVYSCVFLITYFLKIVNVVDNSIQPQSDSPHQEFPRFNRDFGRFGLSSAILKFGIKSQEFLSFFRSPSLKDAIAPAGCSKWSGWAQQGCWPPACCPFVLDGSCMKGNPRNQKQMRIWMFF